jgi:hypothetical protein
MKTSRLEDLYDTCSVVTEFQERKHQVFRIVILEKFTKTQTPNRTEKWKRCRKR